jgi:hypothetical protein
MAATTQRIAEGQHFAITVTFDDVTGAIDKVDWTVDSGTLTVLLHSPTKGDIGPLSFTASGSRNIPNGYSMVKHPTKNFWYWDPSVIAFDTSWSAAQ